MKIKRSLWRDCVCDRYKLFPCLEFCTPFSLLISHSFTVFSNITSKTLLTDKGIKYWQEHEGAGYSGGRGGVRSSQIRAAQSPAVNTPRQPEPRLVTHNQHLTRTTQPLQPCTRISTPRFIPVSSQMLTSIPEDPLLYYITTESFPNKVVFKLKVHFLFALSFKPNMWPNIFTALGGQIGQMQTSLFP